METNLCRILAYQLAVTIPDSHLPTVTGGVGSAVMTFKNTFHVTGPTTSLDGSYDAHCDW